jgi:hypothetical protein
MTKTRIICELLHAVYNALDSQMSEDEYADFLKGSVNFRLDLVRQPSRTFVNVDLPSKTATPKRLEITFHRSHKRLVDRLSDTDTPVVSKGRKGPYRAKKT